VAEDRARRVISLPLFPAMDERDVTDVADALRDLLA
jgi:dTDP-4-amino-4,6-dideoxygalactose transaminase